MFAKASIEVVKGSRHKVAVFRSECQANIINDSGADGFGIFSAMFSQYEGQSNNKQERAEGIALRNSLFKGVANGVVDVKGGEGVGSEMHTGSIVVKKTEPGGQNGAIDVLNGVPNVFAQDVIKGFLQITGDQVAAQLSGTLGSLNKFLASTRDSDAKIKVGYEIECLTLRESLLHYHIRRNANKGLGDAEIAKLDSGALGVFVEQSAIQVTGPMSQPSQATTSQIFDKGAENGPVGVGVLIIFVSGSQVREQLDPGEAKPRDARR